MIRLKPVLFQEGKVAALASLGNKGIVEPTVAARRRRRLLLGWERTSTLQLSFFN
jgi:hypothetical protein